MRLLTNTPRDIEKAIREPKDQPLQLASYTVAKLPSAVAWPIGVVHASNGRKAGEGVGAGTGVPVWSDRTNWRTFYDNSVVAA